MAFSVSCIQCGEPATLPALSMGYASSGDAVDYLWLCSAHRQAAQVSLGRSNSPGRPPLPAGEARIRRYRQMSASMRVRRSSQAPSSSPPRMPASSPPAPSAPGMPAVGPWS
jgi:hypothetical protein